MVLIRRKRLDDRALPFRSAYDSAVGYDVATIDVVSSSDTTLYLTTGYSLEIPDTHYIEVHARSSLHKRGWMLSNSVGIIDSDYRGPIIICLTPIDKRETPLSLIPPIGEYIVQLIVKEKVQVQWEDTDTLTSTNRGEGGLGSSDRV